MNKITSDDFKKILDFEIEPEMCLKIDEAELIYRDLSNDERDEYILNYVDVLTKEITKSGNHRITEWESGWNENLVNFIESNNEDDLVPKYHGKNRIVRWLGEPVLPLVDNFDYKIHTLFVDCILKKYLGEFENVFEFGCGPAFHLLRLRKYFPEKILYGLDWTEASQNIITKINEKFESGILGKNFNFFNPDYNIDIPKNSAIYTIAALEQVGTEHEKFIKFILDKNPDVCIHMEPIGELLDSEKLMDNLCIRYFKKRNYLEGFLTKLEELEDEGKIQIIKKQRILNGSYFIEGHSLVIWRPITNGK
jgi:hypothetical protein